MGINIEKQERICPRCGSHRISRSRFVGLERRLKRVLRPYRCLDCQTRYRRYIWPPLPKHWV